MYYGHLYNLLLVCIYACSIAREYDCGFTKYRRWIVAEMWPTVDGEGPSISSLKNGLFAFFTTFPPFDNWLASVRWRHKPMSASNCPVWLKTTDICKNVFVPCQPRNGAWRKGKRSFASAVGAYRRLLARSVIVNLLKVTCRLPLDENRLSLALCLRLVQPDCRRF